MPTEFEIKHKWFLENFNFVQDNWKDIQEKYEGMWIAVLDKKIIAASEKHREMFSQCKELTSCEKSYVYTGRIPFIGELLVL